MGSYTGTLRPPSELPGRFCRARSQSRSLAGEPAVDVPPAKFTHFN